MNDQSEKLRNFCLAAAAGMLLLIWIGSYVYLRRLNIQSIGTMMCGARVEPGDRCHTVPVWADRLGLIYEPLILIDSKITGVRIHFHREIQF